MKLICYYRVSTQKQGDSGLGLEGQEASCVNYATANGYSILASYVEVESGKNNERPKLQAALLHAKRSGAKLCVAKLDRLSRNAHFLTGLMESKVPFVACDNPHANELTIGILAIIAQHEAKMISERTCAALQSAKNRGVKLGSNRVGHWDGREDVRLQGLKVGRERSISIRKQQAQQAHEELSPIILGMKNEGLTLKQIAERLNQNGWRTRQGKEFSAVHVHLFLKRC